MEYVDDIGGIVLNRKIGGDVLCALSFYGTRRNSLIYVRIVFKLIIKFAP